MTITPDDLRRHASAPAIAGDEARERDLWKRGRRRRAGRRAASSLVVAAVVGGAAAIPVSFNESDTSAIEVAVPSVDEGRSDRPAEPPTDDIDMIGDVADYRRAVEFAATGKKPAGAMEVEAYVSLDEMVTWASAVVVARITSVQDPYVFQSEESAHDTYEVPRLTIAVDQLLAGDLDPRWGTEELTLSWLGDGISQEEAVPDIPMIFFLRDYDDPEGPLVHSDDRGAHPDELGAYRVVSSQGLYLATPDGEVVAPTVESEPTERLLEAAEGEVDPPPAEETHDPVLREIRERGLAIDGLVAEIADLGDERIEPWDDED